MNTRRIYLLCDLSQGSFSGEVVFEVAVQNQNTSYVGVAPKRDCFKLDGQPFGENELPSGENVIQGKLATRLIANGGNVARVALPDGEAVMVSAELILEREPESSHVFV